MFTEVAQIIFFIVQKGKNTCLFKPVVLGSVIIEKHKL